MDISEREQDIRASTGIAYEWIESGKDTQIPPYDTLLLAKLVDNDNVLSAAFDATVDVATMNGYGFYGKDADKVQRVFDDVLNFDETLDNIFYQLLRGNAFLELVPVKDSEISYEVYPLESREVEIKFDKHGEVLSYVQKPRSESAPEVVFNRENIIHFRNKWVGSSPYSQNPLASIENAVRVKNAGLIYLESIFQNFPPKLMYILKQASKDQAEAFKGQLRVVKNTPGRDLVAFGDADVKETGINLFQNGLVEILEYLRKEIAMITRIPPSWVGVREAGGRGQSETETLSFFSRIKKMQQKVESCINKELLPKLGFFDVKFKFHPISATDEKVIMEVAERMKNMLFEDEVILYYMQQKGINLPPNAAFKEPEMESMDTEDDMEPAVGKKNKDLMPSRQRKDMMVDNKGSMMNEQGVSDAGRKKLDAVQMRTRSASDDEPEDTTPSHRWVYQVFS